MEDAELRHAQSHPQSPGVKYKALMDAIGLHTKRTLDEIAERNRTDEHKTDYYRAARQPTEGE